MKWIPYTLHCPTHPINYSRLYNTNNNCFTALKSRITRVSQYQKQSDTLTPAIIAILHSTSSQSSRYHESTHLLSINFKLFISPSTNSFHHVLFGLSHLTTKSIHFFTHSLSSILHTPLYIYMCVCTSLFTINGRKQVIIIIIIIIIITTLDRFAAFQCNFAARVVCEWRQLGPLAIQLLF